MRKINKMLGCLALTASLALMFYFVPLARAADLGADYVPGEVLVKYRPAKISLKSLAGRSAASKFITGKKLFIAEHLKRQNISVVRGRAGESTQTLLARLANDPNVEYVEPNYTKELLTIDSNDTDKNWLWGLDNTGQSVNGTVGTADADIDAPEAWVIDEGTNTSTIVAVIDTGVAYNHPDLSANMWDGANCKDENGDFLGGCVHGYDFAENDKEPLPVDNSHGTHVAGTIVAVKNNNEGIIGVAPNVKIMALPFALDTVTEIKAIDFAIQNGAKVINASYGDPSFSQSEYDAIERFTDAGGIFVAAAGNSSHNNESVHNYPSDYDLSGIIGVAATDQNDLLASFSNYGTSSIDVGAPGVNIYSTIVDFITTSSENFNEVVTPTLPVGWTSTGTNNYWGTAVRSSGNNSFYVDPSHSPYTANASSTVTSPVYNFSGLGGMAINLYAGCDSEYTTSTWTDYMTLETSGDGVNFTEIARWDEAYLDSNTSSVGWAYLSLTFTIPEADLTGNFQFRFHWVSDASNTPSSSYGGCFVDNIYLKQFSSSYDFYNGTSMATPHVVGLAGLIWGYRPDLSASQVKSAILDTGDSLPALTDKTVTGKRINAYQALLSVVPPNHTPVAIDDYATTTKNVSTTINVLANDTDADSDILIITSTTDPSHGNILVDTSTITYTPSSSFVGSDSFAYIVADTHGATSSAIVYIVVVNSAPVAHNDTTTLDENTSSTIDILANDTDVDGDTLSIVVVGEPAHGTAVTSSNYILYTPVAYYNGTDTFSYTIADTNGTTSTAQVDIIINLVNYPPVLADISNQTIYTNQELNFTVSASDVDSDTLTYSLSGSAWLNVSTTAGVISGTPTTVGVYNFTLYVSDGVTTTSKSFSVSANRQSSGGGGGGGGYVAPVTAPGSPSVSVISNHPESNYVTLLLSAINNPTQMAVSDSVNFIGASWSTFVSNTNFIYSATASGTVNIYAKFKNTGGESAVASVSFVVAISTVNNTSTSSNSNATASGDVVVKNINAGAQTKTLFTGVPAVDKLITQTKFGQASKNVRTLQTELKKLGFFPKSQAVTGYYGQVTTNAVKSYLKSKANTQDAIVAPTSAVDKLITQTKFGQASKNVRTLQTELKKLGFFPKSQAVTGYYGTVTREAIKKYLASK